MSLSAYNIRKWIRMLTGKSEMHVHQTMGTHFVPGDIKGYFNNMIEKVTKEPELLDSNALPMNHSEHGDVVFPVTIFQYALGLFDLYLETKESKFIIKFFQLANWAIDNQEESGAWNNFGFIYPNAPYGSMAQGEGASLLIRAYIESQDERFLNAARKAIDFMLLPMSKGGTVSYEGHELYLYEFTNKPIVLNGWVFSLFGIYDLNIVSGGYDQILVKSTKTLIRRLKEFDNGYWSMYDLEGRIASPFYHDLHIAQLEALSITFGEQEFEKYKEIFVTYKNKQINRRRAFFVKAIQKIKE